MCAQPWYNKTLNSQTGHRDHPPGEKNPSGHAVIMTMATMRIIIMMMMMMMGILHFYCCIIDDNGNDKDDNERDGKKMKAEDERSAGNRLKTLHTFQNKIT